MTYEALGLHEMYSNQMKGDLAKLWTPIENALLRSRSDLSKQTPMATNVTVCPFFRGLVLLDYQVAGMLEITDGVVP